MGAGFAGGEGCEGMSGEGEGGQEVVGFGEERGDGFAGKGGGEDEVAVAVVGGELGRSERRREHGRLEG